MQTEEQIYTESEILQVLYGLDSFYLNRHWLTRWMFKPWHDALMTAGNILCGQKLLKDNETNEFVRSVEDHLGDN